MRKVEIGPIEAVNPSVEQLSTSPFIHVVLSLKPDESVVIRGITRKRLYYRLKWLRLKRGVETCILDTSHPEAFRICLKKKKAAA